MLSDAKASFYSVCLTRRDTNLLFPSPKQKRIRKHSTLLRPALFHAQYHPYVPLKNFAGIWCPVLSPFFPFPMQSLSYMNDVNSWRACSSKPGHQPVVGCTICALAHSILPLRQWRSHECNLRPKWVICSHRRLAQKPKYAIALSP